MATTRPQITGTTVAEGITGSNPCSFLNPLANFQMSVLAAINRKINALRRLAEILEAVGDLNPFPALDLGQLVPLGRLDLSAYNNIQRNCPFLNLPPAPEGDASEVINELRSKIIAAYNGIISEIMNHPWFRLGELFKQLDRFQDQVNATGALAGDYLSCFSAICEAAANAGQTLDYYRDQAQQYANNFTADGYPNILTQGARTKYDLMREQVQEVQRLAADVAEIGPSDINETPATLPPLPSSSAS
jgi:hypothetical protein